MGLRPTHGAKSALLGFSESKRVTHDFRRSAKSCLQRGSRSVQPCQVGDPFQIHIESTFSITILLIAAVHTARTIMADDLSGKPHSTTRWNLTTFGFQRIYSLAARFRLRESTMPTLRDAVFDCRGWRQRPYECSASHAPGKGEKGRRSREFRP